MADSILQAQVYGLVASNVGNLTWVNLPTNCTELYVRVAPLGTNNYYRSTVIQVSTLPSTHIAFIFGDTSSEVTVEASNSRIRLAGVKDKGTAITTGKMDVFAK